MIVAALYDRRQTLMGQPEWSAVAISMHKTDFPSASSSGLAYLLDVLAQLPLLYQEWDKSVSTSPQPGADLTKTLKGLGLPDSVRPLLKRSLQLRDDLILFKTRLKGSYIEIDFPSRSVNEIPSVVPYPYTAITIFPSLQTANVFALYNTSIILINQFIISAFALLPVCEAELVAEKSLATEQLSVATREIVKSVHGQLLLVEKSSLSNKPAYGFHDIYLLLSIRVAHRALLQSEYPEDISNLLWLDIVLRNIRSRGGPWMSNRHIFEAENLNRSSDQGVKT